MMPAAVEIPPIVVTVKARHTAEVFVLMRRFGSNYWSAFCYQTLPEAEAATQQLVTGSDVWRIVKISGLPAMVAEGEV
jgi:hypothetical protein